MNAALQGGSDIGWKLAWTLRGWFGDNLFTSYESERRPVVEHNVARSADPAGSRRQVESELHVDIGGRLAHIWLPSKAFEVSTLDLLTAGWTLITNGHAENWLGERARVRRTAVSRPVPAS